jgi:DNA polymerase-3 subunit delta
MIIFLYGPDTFRSRRLLQEMKQKFIKDIDSESHSAALIDGQTATLKEIGEQINTGSLFVKKRLVVIENIFKSKKEKIFAELAGYLKRFTGQDDNIIIFRDEELNSKDKPLRGEAKKLFDFLSQQPYVQESKTLSNAQLLSFIKKEATRYQKTIDAPTASRLINLTGGDMWLIAGEIKKLADRSTEPMITTAMVEEMVTGSFSEDIFAFTDALSTKNKNLALRLLEEQYAAGLSDEYLLTMLVRQFKILTQVKEALEDNISPNDLAVKLKLHPFVAKKSVLQCRNFSLAFLKDYLNRLIALDFNNKTGRGDVKTELTLLISRL